MIEGIIYRYKSPSGKYYIGQTIDEYSRRTIFLNVNLKYGGPKIENARKKYGPENFEYTVLMKVTGDNKEEVKQYLDTLEIGFIKMYDSINIGYNSNEGGLGNRGYKPTKEHIERTRKSLKEKDIIPWNKGKKCGNRSEETKLKISQKLKGKHPSDETRKKLSESHKGKIISKEQREKMINSLKGHIGYTKGKHRVYNPDGTYHYE